MGRLLSPVPLAIALFALAAFPARADGGVHVFRGMPLHRAAHLKTFGGFRHFSRFGNSAFFAPFAWDWDDEGGPPVVAGGAPGAVIVLNLAQPAPVPPPGAARATVETEHGVMVVRGPDSHP